MILLILPLLFPPLSAIADLQSECTDYKRSGSVIVEKSKIRRSYTPQENGCDVTVSSDAEGTKLSRRFIFSNNGKVTIISSSPSEKQFSTQSFILFPAMQVPDYSKIDDRSFFVQVGSGMKWKIDARKSIPLSMSDCEVKVAEKHSVSNPNVEIGNCQKHLLIQVPPKKGSDYVEYSTNVLELKDPKGKVCFLQSGDLYKYTGKFKNGRYDNYIFKFSSNKQLKSFLEKKCAHSGVDLSLLDVDTQSDIINKKPEPQAEAKSSSDELKKIQQQIREEEGLQ